MHYFIFLWCFLFCLFVFNEGNMEETNSSCLMFVYVFCCCCCCCCCSFVWYLCRDWLCAFDLRKGLYVWEEFWNMHNLLVTVWSSWGDLALFGWQDVQIQLLTNKYSQNQMIVLRIYIYELLLFLLDSSHWNTRLKENAINGKVIDVCTGEPLLSVT